MSSFFFETAKTPPPGFITANAPMKAPSTHNICLSDIRWPINIQLISMVKNGAVLFKAIESPMAIKDNA